MLGHAIPVTALLMKAADFPVGARLKHLADHGIGLGVTVGVCKQFPGGADNGQPAACTV